MKHGVGLGFDLDGLVVCGLGVAVIGWFLGCEDACSFASVYG